MARCGARPGVQDCRPNPGVDVDRPGECCVDTREQSLPSAGVDVRLRLHGREAELDELAAADHPGLELSDCRPAHSAQCWAWRHGKFWPVEAGGQRGCGQLSGAGRPALTACVWPTPGTRSHRTLARFGARTSAGNTPAGPTPPRPGGTNGCLTQPEHAQRPSPRPHSQPSPTPPRPRGTNGCLTQPEHPQKVPARAGGVERAERGGRAAKGGAGLGRAGGSGVGERVRPRPTRAALPRRARDCAESLTPPQKRRSGSRPPTSPRD